ncbi:hypothetical protein, partial [Rosenbergiella collisarenosi]|uniref:hypothetical protein n=1 Tax=Rosenbergiella collisarenosi TaxID=1544695 RepID=UPI001F4F1FD6
EKREELANYARARLASHVVYGGCSDEEDIFKIALASLTAETFLYAVDSDVEDKIYTVLCSEHEVGSYPLYTAPPVPEIKLIEPADFIRKWNNSDDCPLAGL